MPAVNFLCLVGLVASVFASSDGKRATICDPDANWGCDPTKLKQTPPWKCEDPNKGLMEWVKKPVRTAKYSLRSADGPAAQDPSTYTPGAENEIHIRVLAFGYKYRGLSVVARNSANKNVGSWKGDDWFKPIARAAQDPNDNCHGAILHTHAALKPYHYVLKFLAPPKGTGKLTFKALIKRGDANTGEFYKPLQDLVLDEGPESTGKPTPTDGSQWFQSDAAQSCSAACKTKGLECTAISMRTQTSETLKVLWQGISCPNDEVQLACSPVAPIIENVCFSYQCNASQVAQASAASKLSEDDMLCRSYAAGTKRICACADPTKNPDLFGSPTPAPTPADGSPTPANQSPTPANQSPTPPQLCGPPGVCNWLCYLNRYSDLQKAFANDTAQAERHYNNKGKSENRTCTCDETCKPTPNPTPKPTSNSNTSPTTTPIISSGTTTVASFFTVVGLICLSTLSSTPTNRSSLMYLVAILLLVMTVPTVNAHNWLWGPSRYAHLAKTGVHCGTRRAADTHFQVGPGQPVNAKFATGHGTGNAIFVVMEGKDEYRMHDDNYLAWVDKYIDDAPASANMIKTAADKRVHGPYKRDGETETTPLTTTDPEWIPSEVEPPKNLYRYLAGKLNNDKHVSYESTEFPWILAAHRYPIIFGAAHDYDAVRIPIPDRGGVAGANANHYVVHWYWSGYSDCIDVNKWKTKTQTKIEGSPGTFGTAFYKVDHCQYQDPDMYIGKLQVVPPGSNADKCLPSIEQNWHFKGDTHSDDDKSTRRFGVQTVPITKPSKVKFANTAAPFDRGLPLGQPGVTLLQGKVTHDRVDWAKWETRTTVSPDKECAKIIWTRKLTLRDAIIKCTADYRQAPLTKEERDSNVDQPQICFGISGPNGDLKDGKEYSFNACGDAGATAKQGRTVYQKKASAFPSTQLLSSPGPIRKISFQPAEFAKPAGYEVDKGDIFGDRGNGMEYGWNCQGGGSFRNTQALGSTGLEAYVMFAGNGDSGTAGELKGGDLFENVCPDGSPMAWDIKVDNGIYKVWTLHNAFASNFHQGDFIIEGHRVPINRGFSWARKQDLDPQETIAEVLDGKLTIRLDSGSGAYSPLMNWVHLQKVAEVGSRTPAWLPASDAKGAFWQMELQQPEPVGVVQIGLPPWDEEDFGDSPFGGGWKKDPYKWPRLAGQYWRANPRDCRAAWLFTPAYCGERGLAQLKDAPFAFGPFEGPNVGAEVIVHDQPCTESGGCPSGGQKCGQIKWGPECTNRWLKEKDDISTVQGIYQKKAGVKGQYCKMDVKCKGATGKYIQIRLPGSGRIFGAAVKANRHRPKLTAQTEGALACYGVEARKTSPTEPEFITTDDPEDMIFYSTCYVRDTPREFEKTGNEPEPQPPQYKFHNMCLDCASYKANQGMYNVSALTGRFWTVAGICVDCDKNTPFPVKLGDVKYD
eukprot:CAMPEP_0175131328 /NCGR_PEP_ID=MMETSP0087-20121206/6483_1 /TAXON_ID=136419 /ORGANISM="Unknown Unknown, Strain D1" /LENGTH=1426 /DNA_ID=CAMNT_0016413609 /DNA_START=30 /DNA_END=4310 /DNA_ORIENTATION=-